MKALKLLAIPVLATILTPFLSTARDLPAGWTRVLYVQGNPSEKARIKANYNLNSGRRIVAEVEFTDLSGTMALWCSRNTEYQGSYSCFLNSNSVQFDYYGSNANLGNGERVRLATGGLSIGDKWTIVMDDVDYSVSNGKSTYEGSASTITTKMGGAWQSMTLFAAYAQNQDANLGSYANYRLYSMKEYKNGDLVHDLVPCIDADGNATVYDLVDDSTAVFTVVGKLIAGKPVYESDFAAEVPDQVFDGWSSCEPHPVVTSKTGGGALVEGQDYTLSWADNDRAGKGELIVTGINAYAGQKGNFFFSIFSEYGRGKVFYAMPDGADDADCQTWNTAGSLSNALAKLNAAPMGTASDWNWVVLLAGSPDNPAIYDLSSFAGGDLASFTTLSKSYMGIRSAAIDHDARSTVIRGGGTAKKMRFAQTAAGTASSPTAHQVLDITFEDFCSQGAGGVIQRGGSYTTLTVSNCVFRNNMAVSGVGGALTSPIAYDCTFVGNVATNNGTGGGACNGGSFYGCSFVSNVNYSAGHYAGGAIYGGDDVVVSNCSFLANLAAPTDGLTGKQDYGQTLYGGTVYDSCFTNSSGISCRGCYRSEIVSGAATRGGNYQTVFYDCVMTNCTKVGGTGYNCLVIGCDSGDEVLLYGTTLYNSTIVNNKTTGTAVNWNKRVISVNGRFYNCVFCNPDARAEFSSNGQTERGTAEHCLMLKNSGVTATDCMFMDEKGWTLDDLRFEGSGEHPYNLKANSPLVDAGALYSWHATAACTNDIRGLKRVSGKTVDLGCYEYQQLTADFEIAEIPVQRYNGIDPCQPDPVVTLKDGGAVLVKGQDYLVSWSDNDKLGEALLTVSGIGAYAGQGATRTFTVKSAYGDGRIFFAKPDGSATSDCLSWATAGTISNAVGKMMAASGSATAAERWWVVLWAGTPESPAVYDLSALADGSRQSYVSLTKGYTGLRSSADDLDARRIIVKGGGVAAAAKMRFATVSQVNDFWGITFENFCSQGGGGAIYASGNAATLSVSNCNFTGNTTYSGGGGAIFGCKYAYGCDFTGNVSTNTGSYGGAINGGVSAYDCSFVSNRIYGTSHFHSGALAGAILVDRCYFEENTANKNSSSSTYQNWGNTIGAENCVISNSVFVRSSGICVKGVYRSVFRAGCSAAGNNSLQNAIFYDCVITNGCTKVSGTCYNCLIADNDSGMDNLLSGTFYNSTVVNNKTTGTGGSWYQRCVAGGQASATLYNCFFYNPDAYREFGYNGTPVVTAYSCFLTTTAGVTAKDCTFVNTLGSTVEERWNALRLDWDSPYPYIQKRASPLVNAGTNLAIHATAACTNDIRGVRRIIGGRVDVGCYEYMPKIGLMLLLK